MTYTIGIDVGGTKVLGGVVDASGKFSSMQGVILHARVVKRLQR